MNLEFIMTNRGMLSFFIKSFSIVFCLLLFVYAIVMYRQVVEISKAVINDRNKFILFISFIQMYIALGLLIFAIFFV